MGDQIGGGQLGPEPGKDARVQTADLLSDAPDGHGLGVQALHHGVDVLRGLAQRRQGRGAVDLRLDEPGSAVFGAVFSAVGGAV